MPILLKNKPIISFKSLAVFFPKLLTGLPNFLLDRWCLIPLQNESSMLFIPNIQKTCKMMLGENFNLQNIFQKRDIPINNFQLEIKALFQILT